MLETIHKYLGNLIEKNRNLSKEELSFLWNVPIEGRNEVEKALTRTFHLLFTLSSIKNILSKDDPAVPEGPFGASRDELVKAFGQDWETTLSGMIEQMMEIRDVLGKAALRIWRREEEAMEAKDVVSARVFRMDESGKVFEVKQDRQTQGVARQSE